MTDRNNMINTVEGWLGDQTSPEQATAVFEILCERGVIRFDPVDGFVARETDNNDGGEWLCALLQEADARVEAGEEV